MVRPLPCCSGGSFPVRMEMKMMLSMPRTISSRVSVPRATQALGSAIQSNMGEGRSEGRASYTRASGESTR